MLEQADNMPAKWQFLIFLGQQTILNILKNGTVASKRSCFNRTAEYRNKLQHRLLGYATKVY